MPKREKGTWANQLVEIIESVKLYSRPSGATTREVADRIGVSERTVYRLLDTLARMGLPLVELEGDGRIKRYKLEDGCLLKLPKLPLLDFEEILALYALKGNLAFYQGTGIEDAVQSAFGKLATMLPPETATMLERYGRLFVPIAKQCKVYEGKEEVIDDLHYAILNRTCCRIAYHSFHDDEDKRFTINPLHFFEHDGGLYLIVVTTSYGEFRTLAVERIQAVEILDRTFDYPADFSPKELLSPAFGIVFDDPISVKIRFSADQARYIKERTWARQQAISDQPDGSIILTMETSGRWDVIRWVMSFGEDAELLEPEEIRQEIIRNLQASLQRMEMKTRSR